MEDIRRDEERQRDASASRCVEKQHEQPVPPWSMAMANPAGMRENAQQPRICAWVTLLPGATLCVSQTLPPMVEPAPTVMRPRMVAPA